MKLSVIIICWNDADYILNCVRSIYAETDALDFEIIVSDNGSTDGSVEKLRAGFPQVRIVENGANLGFARGNNAAFRAASGEYVLILNPDTIIRARALERLVSYADAHPDSGAFGCRVLNPDGSFQHTAQPVPTVWRYFVAAIGLSKLGHLLNVFVGDTYEKWNGRTDREIGFQAGCMLLVRNTLLKQLGGFDERFFHQFEDADLCYRIAKLGYPVRYCPDAEIIHIGGYRRGTYPLNVIIETERSKYKFFYKHHGAKGAIRIRYVSMLRHALRYAGYRVKMAFAPSPQLQTRAENAWQIFKWHWQLNPTTSLVTGEEAKTGPKRFDAKRNRAVANLS